MKQKVLVWICLTDSAGKVTRVLCLRTLKSRGDYWQPVTGSVEKGEKLPQAAMREAREETGIGMFAGPIRDLGYSYTFESRGEKFEEHCFALNALGSAAKTPVIRIADYEHYDYRWVTLEEARGLVKFPDNARALEKLLTKG